MAAIMARPRIPPTTLPAIGPTLVEDAGVGVRVGVGTRVGVLDIDIVPVLMMVAIRVSVVNEPPLVATVVIVAMLACVVIVVATLAVVVVATLVAGEFTFAQ
jgi:hypothetical protein